MNDEQTTAVIQRCLDALQGDAPAEPLIQAMVERLRLLCAVLLNRIYPRLARQLNDLARLLDKQPRAGALGGISGPASPSIRY